MIQGPRGVPQVRGESDQHAIYRAYVYCYLLVLYIPPVSPNFARSCSLSWALRGLAAMSLCPAPRESIAETGCSSQINRSTEPNATRPRTRSERETCKSWPRNIASCHKPSKSEAEHDFLLLSLLALYLPPPDVPCLWNAAEADAHVLRRRSLRSRRQSSPRMTENDSWLNT